MLGHLLKATEILNGAGTQEGLTPKQRLRSSLLLFFRPTHWWVGSQCISFFKSEIGQNRKETWSVVLWKSHFNFIPVFIMNKYLCVCVCVCMHACTMSKKCEKLSSPLHLPVIASLEGQTQGLLLARYEPLSPLFLWKSFSFFYYLSPKNPRAPVILCKAV